MSWLADQKIGHAHIKVTPNEMGPVEVRLHLDGDKVNASFTAANADTRQALEQSLPRLREMLGQNGFQQPGRCRPATAASVRQSHWRQ